MRNIPFSLSFFLGCLFVFSLLLFRDPFSQRTLIPNFEPFPDALYYVGGAKALVEGHGLNLVRDGRALKLAVPPLYSLAIAPAIWVSKDPRAFYFVNVLLSLVSAVLFYQISKKMIANIWIVNVVFFLYITNYFFYWYPTLAMAENLILPLFLLGVYLLIDKATVSKTIIAGCLAVTFYATKYASFTMMFSFASFYFIKLMISNYKATYKVYLICLFLGLLSLQYFLFAYYEFLRGNSDIVSSALAGFSALFKNVFIHNTSIAFSQNISVFHVSQDFNKVNFINHLPIYWNWLNGGSIHFLWDTRPILPQFIGSLGLIGLGAGIFIKKIRFASISLIVLLFSSVFFIATFYAIDGRYVYHAIPTLLIGFGILMQIFSKALIKKKLKIVFYAILVAFFAQYLFMNGIRMKKQIMLNIKYAETPWYYTSILETNKFFSSPVKPSGKKPVLISAMPPHLFDYFSNHNYTLLPLSKDQEFWKRWEVVWGPNDYSDFIKLYDKYLNEGFNVYVSRYGIGNESYLNNDFRLISENFILIKVLTGCFEQCNIYKLTYKNPDE